MSRQDAQSSGHAPSCGLNYDWLDVQFLGGVRYLSLDAEAELDTSIVPGGGIEVDADDDVWDEIIDVRSLANLSDKRRNRAVGIRLVNNRISSVNKSGQMKRIKLFDRFMTVEWIMGAIALFTSFVSTAADAAGTTPTSDEWQFKVQAYGWLPTIEGTLPTDNNIELTIDEIFDYLDMTFMGAFQARRDKWAIVTDVVYLKLSTDKAGNITIPVGSASVPARVDIGVDMKTWIVDLASAYRVYQTDKYDVQFLGGVRYLSLDAEAELDTSIVPGGGIEVDADDDVWDGIIGVRGLANLSDKWWLTYRFDVGTGGSDVTWNTAVQFGRKYDWGSLAAGYRYLHYDFDSDFKPLKDLDVYGPFIGAIWEF